MGEAIADIFLYGTLLPGRAPLAVAPAVARLREVGRAAVCGLLYDFRHYPGAILQQGTRHCIRGRVFRLPDDPAVLAALDAYEGYDCTRQAESLFLRVPCVATLEDGQDVTCWIYVYNQPLWNARRIESGEFA